MCSCRHAGTQPRSMGRQGSFVFTAKPTRRMCFVRTRTRRLAVLTMEFSRTTAPFACTGVPRRQTKESCGAVSHLVVAARTNVSSSVAQRWQTALERSLRALSTTGNLRGTTKTACWELILCSPTRALEISVCRRTVQRSNSESFPLMCQKWDHNHDNTTNTEHEAGNLTLHCF